MPLPRCNRSVVGKDAYFTSGSVIDASVELVAELGLPRGFIVLDFSAGDGAWGRALSRKCEASVTSLDIEPRSNDVLAADFLEYNPARNNLDLVGFNPPFGSRGKLAKAFVVRAAELMPMYMLLLLPKFRGSFGVAGYDVLRSTALEPASFYNPDTRRVLKVPNTTMWLLRRTQGCTAWFSLFTAPDLSLPPRLRNVFTHHTAGLERAQLDGPRPGCQRRFGCRGPR